MKPKHKKKVYFEPDSSSDSDTPLVELRPSSINNGINCLFKYSVEKCEFCDKIFNNKYSMLVHNAKHIIIPLLNQNVHKCSQCHRMFNSVESLEWHSVNSHAYISENKDYLPKILQSFVQKQPMMVLRKEPLISKDSSDRHTDTVNGDDNVPEILQSMVMRQPVTMVTKLIDPVITDNESILQSLVKKEPVTLLKRELFKFEDDAEVFSVCDNDDSENNSAESVTTKNDNRTNFDIDNEDTESVDIKTENAFEYINIDSSDCENIRNPRIKDRIMFEDDGDINFSELVDTHTSVNAESKNDQSNRRKNAIIIGNKPNAPGNEVVNAIETAKSPLSSVHYDELRKPGLYKCKKCSQMFPNRYEAIVHEKIHIIIKRPRAFVCRFCDWYVATSPGSLKRHKMAKHEHRVDVLRPLKKCKDCSLSYSSISRHRQNYHHEFKCCFCAEIFPRRSDRSDHVIQVHHKRPRSKKHVFREKTQTILEITQADLQKTQESDDSQWKWKIKTMKVCDFCHKCLRDRLNLKYQFVANFSKIGERVQCDRCVRMFFELKIVRVNWRRIRGRPRKQDKDCVMDIKQRPMSNADRLRNVQQRLKKMKALNKL